MTWCPLGQHWRQTEPSTKLLSRLEQEGKRWVCLPCLRATGLPDYPNRVVFEKPNKEKTP